MMPEPEAFRFADDGAIPNSPLPLLLWRGALPADPAAIEREFAAHGWSNSWRGGVFPYHHFHSVAHEALGVAGGTAEVLFGGPQGRAIAVAAGDVLAIPAGVGHCRVRASDDFLVVGAYPGGAPYDIRRGNPSEAARVRANIAAVPMSAAGPLGAGLPALWRPFPAAG